MKTKQIRRRQTLEFPEANCCIDSKMNPAPFSNNNQNTIDLNRQMNFFVNTDRPYSSDAIR